MNENGEYHVDTNEVLKELQNEGFSLEGTDAPSQEEPKQETAEEPTIPDSPEANEGETIVEPKVIDRKPKEPTLVPAWKAKITQEKLQRENAALQEQIKALQARPAEVTQTGIDNIRALAEEAGVELNDQQEKFFRRITDAIASKVAPKETLQTLQALQQAHEINYLESQFNDEFTRNVLPLVKEKYGEVSDKQLADLRTKLHDTAFTETYAKVPLHEIYAIKERTLALQTNKEPIHTPKSGKTRGTDIDFSQMDESTFSSLSDEQVEAFIASKGGGNWSRR